MPTPHPTPAEKFATILLALTLAVDARRAWGKLSSPLVALIVGRIRDLNQRVARLIVRSQDGRIAPRRPAARRPAKPRRPRQPGPLPVHSGWLLTLVPEAVGYRGQLDHLLRDPEMAALLAAAPAAIRRPLRSLCWMLRLRPPPLLARPQAALPPPPQRPLRARVSPRPACPPARAAAPAWPPPPPPPPTASPPNSSPPARARGQPRPV